MLIKKSLYVCEHKVSLRRLFTDAMIDFRLILLSSQ